MEFSRVTDGNMMAPRQVEPPRLEYPFEARGNRQNYVILEKVEVRADAFARSPLGSTKWTGVLPAGADPAREHFLVQETDPTLRGPFKTWTRIWAHNWEDVVYLDFTTFNKPSLVGLTYAGETPTLDPDTGANLLAGSGASIGSTAQATVGSDTPAAQVSGGSFKIAIAGQESAALDWDADGAALETALRAIPGAPAELQVVNRNAPAPASGFSDPTSQTGGGAYTDPLDSNPNLGPTSWSLTNWVDNGATWDLDVVVSISAGDDWNGVAFQVRTAPNGGGTLLGSENYDTGTTVTVALVGETYTGTLYVTATNGPIDFQDQGSFTVSAGTGGGAPVNDNEFEISLGPGNEDLAVSGDGGQLLPAGSQVDVSPATGQFSDVAQFYTPFATSGDYDITVGANTATIAWDDTGPEIETKLNALASMTAMGGVAVRVTGVNGFNVIRYQVLPKLLFGAYDGEADRRAWLAANMTADFTNLETSLIDPTLIFTDTFTWSTALVRLRSTGAVFEIVAHGLADQETVFFSAGGYEEKAAVQKIDDDKFLVPAISEGLQAAAAAGAITVKKDLLTITQAAHGLTTAKPHSFFDANGNFITRKQITVVDVDTYTITGLTLEEFGAAYGSVSAQGNYYPGSRRMRARFTLKFYQPGAPQDQVVDGVLVPGPIQTVEDIPFPKLEDKGFAVLAAILDGKETLLVDAGQVEYLFGNLIQVTQVRVFVEDLLE